MDRERLRRLLYPEETRHPQWLRWFRISCRTVHLVAISGLVGGHLFGATREQLHPWLAWTLITGVLLVGTFLYESFSWLRQLRGLLMASKLVLILMIPPMWDHRLWLLSAVIVLSSFTSHSPGRIRKWVPGAEPPPELRWGGGQGTGSGGKKAS
jgi:hypothetical protein